MDPTGPIQLTHETCKLAILPCPSGPIIEFTDYATDISWLSGRIYLNASGEPNQNCSHIALNEPSWSIVGDEIRIIGLAGGLKIELHYKLTAFEGIENSTHVEERITVSNPGAQPIAFERFRIGPTWSPPRTWWVYWGYWRLLKLDPDTGSEKIGRTPGEKLSDLKDRLDKVAKARGRLPVPVDYGADATGWIFSDEKKFLLVMKESSEADELCLLDMLDEKPVPTFIMGGIGNVAGGSGWPRQLNPGKSWSSGMTMFIPGVGGWGCAMDLLTKIKSR
jgi:hypothetical protein